MEEILSAAEIQEIIPHRYPFLLVDRIVEIVTGERAVLPGAFSREPRYARSPYRGGHGPGGGGSAVEQEGIQGEAGPL